jgi:hypothetical protein
MFGERRHELSCSLQALLPLQSRSKSPHKAERRLARKEEARTPRALLCARSDDETGAEGEHSLGAEGEHSLAAEERPAS